jgi:hypothetical protein
MNRLLLLLAACGALTTTLTPVRAQTAAKELTTDVPACTMPAGRALPDVYYARPRHGKVLAWASAVTRMQGVAGGEGQERYDGTGIRDWFDFVQVDLNNDDICDWFVTMSAPDSSGGDHDTLNTLYLGQTKGWQRIGAHVAPGDVDMLGSRRSQAEQKDFLFGEGIATIHDTAARVNYFVTSFQDRDTGQSIRPGYRIFTWDGQKKTLRLLDKWLPGSIGAQVYAYFKSHGAHSSDSAAKGGLVKFDPEVEALELSERCQPGADGEDGLPISAGLLAHCPR